MAKHSTQPPTFNHIADAAPEYVDVVLWHRVFLALGGLVVTLAGIGFLLFQLLGNPGNNEMQTAEAINPDTLAAPAAIPDQAPDISRINVTSITPNTAVVEPIGTSPLPETYHTQDVFKTAPVAESKPLTVAMASTETPMPDTRFNVTTEILVPAVKRAIITDTMRGREPGQPVTNSQAISQKDAYSLFQFVDIRGQAGETLTYHWKHNGRTYAKVRIPVGSDKWRNYSSKNFNKNLEGDWQVDVVNSKNILLVRSRFYLGD